MIDITDKSECSGCSACYNVCPEHCIEMVRDKEGFLYPVVDESRCVSCNLCSKVCPIMNPPVRENGLPEAYAAWALDDEIRENSSSGGVFSVLAAKVLDNHGVVVGCALTDGCKTAQHIVIQSKEDLWKLRGSKYLQSQIGPVYRKVKDELSAGREVLFSGTPCQIAGLKSFLLNTRQENLFLVDIICHGVPSPMIWEKYVRELETEFGAPARRASFRYKRYGWKKFSLLLEFSNDREYLKALNRDWYLRGFLSNLYLRPSCYCCKFKGGGRLSDLTLADFWGVENIFPEFNDDKGVSLLLVSSDKGRKLLEKAKNEVYTRSCGLNTALQYNGACRKSADMPRRRAGFWKHLWKNDFNKTMKKFCKVSFFSRLKAKAKALAKKILKRR